MKKLSVLLFACMGFYFSHAQQFSTDEIQYIRDVLKKEKKDLVTQYMALNDTEAAKFWPLYDEFQSKKGDLGKERIQIIKDYADRFNTMTNDQASDIVKRIFKNDKANTALQEKYFKKFAKAVSPLKAAQYLQLEYYFQTLIRSEIQDAIPFIGEIERSKSN